MNNRNIDGELMNIIVRSMTLGQSKNFDKRVDGYDKVRQQIKSLIGKRLLGELKEIKSGGCGWDETQSAYSNALKKAEQIIKDVLNIEGE